jgi:hypothetical protein
MKKKIFIWVFLWILILPLDISSSESRREVTQEEAKQFIEEYIQRFMKLDLDPYMELFSKQAIENRVLPYADIEEAYRRTIQKTHSLLYKMTLYSIEPYTHSAFVRGRYEIVQRLKKKDRVVNLSGEIQFYLIRDNSFLKIREINYGKDW